MEGKDSDNIDLLSIADVNIEMDKLLHLQYPKKHEGIYIIYLALVCCTVYINVCIHKALKM